MRKSITEKNFIPLLLLFVGVLSLIAAFFAESYILALVAMSFSFWGALLLYIKTDTVPLDLLHATTLSSLVNTENFLTENKISAKGVYLPPKFLSDYTKSLVFVPTEQTDAYPKPQVIAESVLFTKDPVGVVLSPSGYLLSLLLEKNLGLSFVQIDRDDLFEKLPGLIIEKMMLADHCEVVSEKPDEILIETKNNVLAQLSVQMKTVPNTLRIIGCPFASAIACAIAKSTGRPVEIDEIFIDGNKLSVRYSLKAVNNEL
jgi:hypothetical protein